MENEKEKKLKESIRSAGDALLRLWPGGKGDSVHELQVEKKSDGSIVTTADFQSNEILVSTIQLLFPDDVILSEELPIDTSASSPGRCWIIDPLDGTHHFAEGRDDFSILVCLKEDTCLHRGYMFFPARDHFLIAARDQGVTLNGSPVTVSQFSQPRDGAIYVRNFSSSSGKGVYPHPMDSGMAFFSLCSGMLDGVMIRMTHHKIWDIAAPLVAVREAGGVVTDESGNEIVLADHEISFRYLVASNGACHEYLLALLKKWE